MKLNEKWQEKKKNLGRIAKNVNFEFEKKNEKYKSGKIINNNGNKGNFSKREMRECIETMRDAEVHKTCLPKSTETRRSVV